MSAISNRPTDTSKAEDGKRRVRARWAVAASLVLLAAVAGCGAGASAERKADTAAAAATPPPAEAPPGSLLRQDVVQAVDEGLGAFLQRLKLEPSLEGARFSGFRVVELVPASFWQDVDLKEGDIVTHVNGKSVEDPAVAFDVFESLRTAAAVEVLVVREGQRRQLRFPILGAPAPRPVPTAQGSEAG